MISKIRIPLSEVHFWEEYVNGYFPFDNGHKKIEVTTKQDFRLILIEDLDRFDAIMADYYEKQRA